MRRIVWAGFAVVVVGVLAWPTREAPSRNGWPSPPESVVFGSPGEPSGGQLVVGLLLEESSGGRLADVLPPETWRELLAGEPARGAAPEDVPAETRVLRPGPDPEASARARALSIAAAAVEKETRVRVVFCDVLPADAAGMALVLRDGSANGILPRSAEAVAPLVRECLEAIRASPRVHRLPADPLEVLDARRDGDDVAVLFRRAPEEATLRDLDDRVVARAEAAADGRVRFAGPERTLDPNRHRLVVSWRGGGLTLRRAWRIADLVGTVEREVLAADVVEAGATFAPRVLYRNSRTGAPVPGVRETVALVRGDAVLAETSGVADELGGLGARLPVPDGAAPGPAELRVGTDRFAVEVRGGLRVGVVTDRALYRPTDEVRARAMVHRAGSGTPVAGVRVTFRCADAEKDVETSAHGIAAATFRLVERMPGPAHVEAAVERTAARAPFRVRAFETPSFLVEADPPSLSVRPGETAPLTVVARYVNGEPLVGGRVAVSGAREVLPDDLAGVTDREGRCALEVRCPEGAVSGSLAVTVTDADGRSSDLAWPVEVLGTTPRDLAASPLDEPIVGRPCRFEVRSSRPGPLVATLEGERSHPVTIDDSGRAVLTATPTRDRFEIRLASPDEARPVRVPMQAATVPARRVFVVPDRRVAALGETLALDLSGPDGVAYVDVVRDGMPLRSLATTLGGGTARLAVPLEEDLAGVLEVRAWRFAEDDRRAAGTRVRVLVVRNRSLVVRAEADRVEWRPAETASLRVRVFDRSGRPVPGVLGYYGVDEALLALAPWPAGDETTFDALPSAPDEPLGRLAAAREAGEVVAFGGAREALGPPVPFEEALPPIRHRTAAARREALETAAKERFEASVARLRAAVLRAFEEMPLGEIRTSRSVNETLRRLVAEGRLDGAATLDPWGTPLRIGPSLAEPKDRWHRWPRRRDEHAHAPGCSSAGPDLLHGTPDDLLVAWERLGSWELRGRVARFFEVVAARDAVRNDSDLPYRESFGAGEGISDSPFEGPARNGLIGIGGGAGGTFACRGGSRGLPGRDGDRPEPPVHLRKDFSPTLCFVPEAIVGPDGLAEIAVPLKDAITTWRLRFVASAGDGSTGTAETTLRVTQPLHAEPWIATHLTVGDDVEVPVAFRNETDAPMLATARLRATPEIEVVGPASAAVEIAPHGTEAHVFRLRARAKGRARVRIDTEAGSERDAVERVVRVRPNAREVVETWNGTLSGEGSWPVAIAARASTAPPEHRLSIYPTPLADTLQGFEGLIACPHG